MNNAELEKLLKSVPVPEREPEFWEQFPKRISVAAHWRESRPADEAESRKAWMRPGLLRWGLGLAAACVVIGFVFALWKDRDTGITAEQLAVARKYYRELEALFPNQIQAIVFDENGPHLVLADRPDVPSAPPVYVRACGPDGCRRFLTFSGQQIQLNSETVDVLVNARGQVLLAGSKLAWTSADANRLAGQWRIAATALNGVPL